MSNNKQSSLDYYITKLTEILGPEIIKQISRDDNERIARLEKQCRAKHKEEMKNSYWAGIDDHLNPNKMPNSEGYYELTFGENKV